MKVKMKLVSSKAETHDTRTITFQGERPDFKPGQFFMVEFLRQEKIPKRAYSVSSSPTRPNIIEFTVKAMPDGYVSKLLNSAPEGEEFMLDGPYGHFVFDPEKMHNIVLLGAGSGFAPFRCFSQYIMDKKLGTKVTMVYGNKTEDDIICRGDIDEFSGKIGGMEVILTLSREEKQGFRHGRIDDALVKEVKAKNPGANYFICGPPAMVNDTKKLLEENGIPKESIKVEVYG